MDINHRNLGYKLTRHFPFIAASCTVDVVGKNELTNLLSRPNDHELVSHVTVDFHLYSIGFGSAARRVVLLS